MSAAEEVAAVLAAAGWEQVTTIIDTHGDATYRRTLWEAPDLDANIEITRRCDPRTDITHAGIAAALVRHAPELRRLIDGAA